MLRLGILPLRPAIQSNFHTRAFSGLRLATKRPANTTLASRLTKAYRTITTDAQPIITRPSSSASWQRLGITALTIGGTAVAVSTLFNRETRDSLSSAERGLLNDSFMYTGAGLGITALAARSMFMSGTAARIMAMNPWVVMGVSLVGSIGSMMGVFYTPVDQPVQKHLFWLAFNGFQAATLSPLFFAFSPALISRAALYTCGVVGSLSYIGATAKNDTYLYMGGPLLAGVTVVALSSLAPMVLPLGIRGLAVAESISLYGGLAVFSGFVLFDTQKILDHGRKAQAGLMPLDPLRESVSLQLDFINIFIRLLYILGMQQKKK